jgi:LysM repeat protein
MALRGDDPGRDSLGLGDAAAIAAAQASASTVAVAVEGQTAVETPLVTIAAETGATVAAAPETQAPSETAAAQESAAPQAVVAAPVCVKTYTVVLGDGWLRIANAHGVTLNELLASNAANVSTFLMVGATICVPANATDPTTTVKVTTPAVTTPAAAAYVAPFSLACTKSYTVVLGDGWLRIANKHGVTMKEVLKVNAASASTVLLVGRKICVPANSKTPTVATTAKPSATPTTKKPKPAPTPTIHPPTRTYTYAEVEAIIREIWPDDLETEALRIAHRESRLNPRAQNYCCYGLFQIYFNVHKKWLAEIGITSGEQLLDPYNAAKAGLRLYQRNGWGPWKL